jgi:hypothetical protein
MRFMVMVTATAESEAGVLPSSDDFEAMGKFNEEMVKAGVMLAAEGLHPTSKGARIRFDGGKTTVTDGPFTESKELIAGFWLIHVKSKEEAIAWLRRAPFGSGTVIELRQLHEAEDFAALDPTGEHRAKEAEFRAAAPSPYRIT